MKRSTLFWLIPVIVIAGIAFWWDHGGQGWLSVQTGTRCGSTGPHYCYWSGFGSVWPFSLFVFGPLLTMMAVNWRAHTCHYAWWCWRRPLHGLEGHELITLCNVHHPDHEPIKVKDAIQQHIHLRRGNKTRVGPQ